MRNPSVIPTLVAATACVALFSAGVSLEKGPSSDHKSAVHPMAAPPSGTTFRQHSTQATTARLIGKIAFASDRDGNLEIYTMDTDGGGQTRLTENTSEDYSPAWSPDGSRLTFVSTRDGNAEIYVMNMDGTEAQPALRSIAIKSCRQRIGRVGE